MFGINGKLLVVTADPGEVDLAGSRTSCFSFYTSFPVSLFLLQQTVGQF